MDEGILGDPRSRTIQQAGNHRIEAWRGEQRSGRSTGSLSVERTGGTGAPEWRNGYPKREWTWPRPCTVPARDRQAMIVAVVGTGALVVTNCRLTARWRGIRRTGDQEQEPPTSEMDPHDGVDGLMDAGSEQQQQIHTKIHCRNRWPVRCQQIQDW